MGGPLRGGGVWAKLAGAGGGRAVESIGWVCDDRLWLRA